MRKIVVGGLLASVLLSGSVYAAPETAGQQQLVPLRAVAEAAGAQVLWDEATSTVTVTRGETTLVLTIGTSAATVNGKAVPVGQPVRTVAGRTLVPADFVTQALGVVNPLNLQVRYEGSLESILFQPRWAAEFETVAQQMYPFAAACPGMSYGIAQDGQALLLRSFGARDCEQSLPMTTGTVMGLGSSTKAFTAVAIMQLQDAGKLSVDDLVTKHLPEYKSKNPEDAKRTTIHHLLTHTAGIPALPTLYFAMAKSLDADPVAPPSLKGLPPVETAQQMIESMVAAPLEPVGEPGQVFSYSNESYALLGEIVHRVSGQPFEAYVTEQILKPAGMLHTVWDDESMATLSEVATLYTLVPQPDAPMGVAPMATPVWWNPGVMNAAGGLRSTVQDMLRFTEIFRNGGVVGDTRILAKESVERMMKPYVEADTGVSYGYGLMLRQVGGMAVVQHGGSIKGASAIFAVVPEKGLAGVGLTNTSGVPSEMILQGGLNLAAGVPVMAGTERRPDFAVAAEQLEQYTGTFAGGEAAPATVSVVNGALVFEQAGMQFPARPVGEDEFAVALGAQEMNIRFMRDGSGTVYAIRLGFRVWRKL